jgi:hypothetical protein
MLLLRRWEEITASVIPLGAGRGWTTNVCHRVDGFSLVQVGIVCSNTRRGVCLLVGEHYSFKSLPYLMNYVPVAGF